MPTKDGEMPKLAKISNDLYDLNTKINSMIKEFKETYNEPAVKITSGGSYKMEILVSHEALCNQYQVTF